MSSRRSTRVSPRWCVFEPWLGAQSTLAARPRIASHALTLASIASRLAGSDEELSDLYAAYTEGKGSLEYVLMHMMCSTAEDEPRFVQLINTAIASGSLKATPKWTKSSTDKGARLARERKVGKEAAEAEAYAKELGIHDKLYGSGPGGAKGGKGKGKGKGGGDDEEGLRALIMGNQKARAERMDSLVAGLEAKYAGGGGGGAKGKKRKSDAGQGEEDSGGKGKKGKKAEEEPSEEECKSACHLFETMGGRARRGMELTKGRFGHRRARAVQRIQAEMDARRKSNGGATATPVNGKKPRKSK